MTLENFFKRHEKVALLFSGGKDSLACLYLCKPWWDKLEVVWINTGKNFPEVEKFMEDIKAMVPHFIEVKTNQDAFIKWYGHPTDVVPVKCDVNGRVFSTEPVRRKLVSKYECCANNIWQGIQKYMTETDCTGFIKGQRNSDHDQAPWVTNFTSGDRKCEMYYPVANWFEEEVLHYLHKQCEKLDERFLLDHSSLDCWDCTAYWGALPNRLIYMKKHHPEKYEHVVHILNDIKRDVEDSVKNLP